MLGELSSRGWDHFASRPSAEGAYPILKFPSESRNLPNRVWPSSLLRIQVSVDSGLCGFRSLWIQVSVDSGLSGFKSPCVQVSLHSSGLSIHIPSSGRIDMVACILQRSKKLPLF
jgi:hypothetical protein